jgi:hypothetical protein
MNTAILLYVVLAIIAGAAISVIGSPWNQSGSEYRDRKNSKRNSAVRNGRNGGGRAGFRNGLTLVYSQY